MLEEFITDFKAWAESFGAKPNGVNCVYRENVKDDAFTKGGAYFGFIQPDEAPSGSYHDFSLVVFPDDERGKWLVSLCVGSLGFKEDYDLAAQPGIRRLFAKLVSENGYNKPSFLDIETPLPKAFVSKEPNFVNFVKSYSSVISACEIIDPTTIEGQNKVKGFLATYAQIREWPINKALRDAVQKGIQDALVKKDEKDDIQEVTTLLEHRKYVVLQGPPGTGKTRMTKLLASGMKAKTFFTQFHAETSYADFVWGIRPTLDSDQLKYESRDGVLIQSIKYAINNPQQKVILIIDEINRANLSNVLGPVFYLFEYQMDASDVVIKLRNDLELNAPPSNLYVIATMNTADRSLAVVDFALRRRFAWYTLWPKAIQSPRFMHNYYDAIASIFEQYASDEELNLQPGQGYFLADSEEEMKKRLKYEIMPLIKEYLTEGLLTSAKNAFSNYFASQIKEELFL